MKTRELKGLGREELKTKLNELKKDFVKLNAQRRTGAAMKNPEQLRQIKKTIAKILHLLNQNLKIKKSKYKEKEESIKK